jgi:hypothetical protein
LKKKPSEERNVSLSEQQMPTVLESKTHLIIKEHFLILDACFPQILGRKVFLNNTLVVA